ncbi:MAG: hypothetical protein J5J06_11075 [Phycisphaerae bacterium]|nr:hypothetical protein [Phycisphaerae bacterium]
MKTRARSTRTHYERYLWAVVTAVSCAGCQSSLPRYAFDNPAEVLMAMEARSSQIASFSARCRVLLASGDGDVQLTGLVIAEPPGRLRLRTWKLSRTVFDLTLNEDGAYLFSSGGERHGPDESELTRKQILGALRFLPGFMQQGAWRARRGLTPDTYALISQLPDANALVQCAVDGATLTEQRCDYLDDRNQAEMSLAFYDYRLVDGIAWPGRITGHGARGSFEIRFDSVEVNVEHPDGAFVPSRRAKKLP